MPPNDLAEHDRPLDAERVAEGAYVVAPLRRGSTLRRGRGRSARCRGGRGRRPARRRRARENGGLKPEWSKPGPPCSSSSVGRSRMSGPSGTSLAPSTSKKSVVSRTRISKAALLGSRYRIGMPERPPCRLAALGVVSALGSGPAETWRGLAAGDQSHFTRAERSRSRPRALDGRRERALPAVPAELFRYACRNNALALAALRADRGRRCARRSRASGAERVGIVVGTSTSGRRRRRGCDRAARRDTGAARRPSTTSSSSSAAPRASSPSCSARAGPPTRSRRRARSGATRARLGARRCSRSASATRSSPAAPTRSAGSRRTASRRCRRSPTSITNPMSANRDGLTLGEGGGALPGDAGAATASSSLGAGESSEAHHMSAPDPEGAGARGGDARRRSPTRGSRRATSRT